MNHRIRPATEIDADAIAEAHQDSIRTLGSGTYNAEVVDIWGVPRSGLPYASAMREGEAFLG